ncbi:hypothetical protein LZ31DRAFT_560400 [Colletotrichum somersetense]|nr:hypothetical protein LZ31DRAFT_560400 [Colletotrichum somersetense]
MPKGPSKRQSPDQGRHIILRYHPILQRLLGLQAARAEGLVLSSPNSEGNIFPCFPGPCDWGGAQQSTLKPFLPNLSTSTSLTSTGTSYAGPLFGPCKLSPSTLTLTVDPVTGNRSKSPATANHSRQNTATPTSSCASHA